MCTSPLRSPKRSRYSTHTLSISFYSSVPTPFRQFLIFLLLASSFASSLPPRQTLFLPLPSLLASPLFSYSMSLSFFLLLCYFPLLTRHHLSQTLPLARIRHNLEFAVPETLAHAAHVTPFRGRKANDKPIRYYFIKVIPVCRLKNLTFGVRLAFPFILQRPASFSSDCLEWQCSWASTEEGLNPQRRKF